MSTAPSTLFLGAVTCTSDADCIAVGGTPTTPGTAVTSTNGGLTWTAAPVPDVSDIGGVGCTTSSDCLASAGNDTLLGSSDGGTVWATETAPSGLKTFGVGLCIPNTGCLARGVSSATGNPYVILQDFPSELAVTTTTLPAAMPGTPYSQTLAATGGAPPYTWKLEKGSKLPKGLKLDKKTGTISGTPSTKAKSEMFTVEVVDAAKDTATATLSIAVT